MENFIQIGQIKKPFGLKGELKVDLEANYDSSFKKASVIFLKERGNHTPYFVEYVNKESGYLLKLEDVDNPEQAKKLSKQIVYLRASDVEIKTPVLDANLKGFEIHDETEGFIGEILAIEEYPQQLIALVTYKEKEILLPLTEALILGIDPEERVILMDLPDGILEL